VIEVLLRTLVVALAWFACINAIGSVLAVSLAYATRRREATRRAWVFLAVRLLPACLSLFFVGAMLLPAQWALEPRDAVETLGFTLNALAIAGAALLLRCAWRAIAVARASHWAAAGSRPYRRGTPNTYVVDSLPGVSLAGVVRPRILIGRTVKSLLSRDELEVAVAHELAHRDAFDNLARWCMFCAPDFLAGSAIAARLEHDWHVAAESRADAKAICGDRHRAVHLASALIKVARLSTMPAQRISLPSWSTLNDSELLEWRVHRLLSGTLPSTDALPRFGFITAILAVSALIAALVFAGPVHRLTEALIGLLP
jgi:hypothetical protein